MDANDVILIASNYDHLRLPFGDSFAAPTFDDLYPQDDLPLPAPLGGLWAYAMAVTEGDRENAAMGVARALICLGYPGSPLTTLAAEEIL